MATGGYDGRVVLWSRDLKVRWTLQAADLVNHVAFSADGSQVAAAVADGCVYLIDTESGALRGQLGPQGDDVNAVAWHPQGRLLACVMDAKDPTVAVWDVRSGTRVASLEGHGHGVFALAFDPRGQRLATAAEDGTARLWSLEERKPYAVLQHPGDPETLDWSSCGRYVATGCDDGGLRIWDAETGRLVEESRAASASVRLVRFSPDARRLLAGSYEGVLRVHAFPGLSVEAVLSAPFQWERSASFFGRAILVGGFGGRPVLHEPSAPPPQVQAPTYGINTLAVAPGGHPICVGRDDGAVVDIRTGAFLYKHPSIVNAVAFAPDAPLVASGDYRGGVVVFDWQKRRQRAAVTLKSGPVNTLAFEPREQGLFTAGYDGVIRHWTRELRLLRELPAHQGPIKSLAWSEPAGVLVAGSSDDTLSGWQGAERLFHISDDSLVLINSVAASPTAPHFATASRDGLVRIWHARTGELLETLPRAHGKSIKAIAYSGDGQRLLTGSYDGCAILWSRQEDGWAFRRLALHGKPGVPAVAFDNEAALTAGWDGTVGRWTAAGRLISQYRVSELE